MFLCLSFRSTTKMIRNRLNEALNLLFFRTSVRCNVAVIVQDVTLLVDTCEHIQRRYSEVSNLTYYSSIMFLDADNFYTSDTAACFRVLYFVSSRQAADCFGLRVDCQRSIK